MRNHIIKIIVILISIFITTSFVWGQEAANSYKMKGVIYGGEIDSKRGFYQKRIYLVDSEYKILAEIGRDAVSKIQFLTAYRQHLINHMLTSNIPLKKSNMNSFLGGKLNAISLTMEAYSTE